MTTTITHHAPERLLIAYAGGALGYAFDMVVAAHVSMCDECRARLGAIEAAGGALVEGADRAEVPDALKARLLDRLDDAPAPVAASRRSGIYPGPVAAALDGAAPRWRSVGMGVKQSILHEDDGGSVRLLHIPPGRAVPEHSHGGAELTLVLQGSFSDATGAFGTGDLEVADGTLEHTPVAGEGAPCICLAATDAPLRFRSWIPRIAQRFIRI